MTMKKILTMLLSLALILGLAACGSNGLEQAAVIEVNTEQNDPGYVEGEDYQIAVGMYGSSYAGRFTKGEGGYYYSIYGTATPLMFYDENIGVTVPVCDRPNCTHDNENCNAYLGQMNLLEHIQYYDGNLYAFGTESSDLSRVDLYRISTDGSTHERMGMLYDFAGDQSAYDVVVHRGHAYGNFLYVRFSYFADVDGNESTGDLYRMNIHTGEMELVMPNSRYDFIANEDYLFYHRDMKVVACNLETQEETEILDNGYSNYLALDGDYLCCDNGAGQTFVRLFEELEVTDPRTMTIMDVTDFSIQKTLVVEDEYCDLVALQGDRIYAVIDKQTADGYVRKTLCYCDWTALEDGATIQWTWMEEG